MSSDRPTDPLSVTLVRHGQSEANLSNLWQGQGDSPLSDEGRDQVKALAGRLRDQAFDVVVASDLARARETAAGLAESVEVDPEWREMDLGGWEGRTFDEVREHHPDALEAIRRGEDVPFGATGETLLQFETRCLAAFRGLAERVGAGSALVATHGGLIDAIVGSALGRLPDRRTFPIVTNTAMTTFLGEPARMRLAGFNDATHLGIDVGFLARMRDEGTPVVGFVRHGVTGANREGRIQGRSCWGLHEDGIGQAEALARWYGPVDRVITSPLRRARETAAALGADPEEDESLAEMAFGDWEGRLMSDLLGSDPLASRIYQDGEDLPRGNHGESFRDVVARMAGFLSALSIDASQRTLVVSHGAAIRALVGSISGREEILDHLATVSNASVTHVALTAEGPVVADYSLCPPAVG